MSQQAGDTSTTRQRPDLPPHPKAARPVLCPYCGEISADVNRCHACGGFFDPLSRQASQNAMGGWYIRDAARPFRPGCSYETLKDLVRRGKITPDTVIRGPTTRQFWTFAGRAPSVANLLGRCHNCHAEVRPDDYMCAACGAAFTPEHDRQHLGLGPVHLLPNQAPPEVIAAVSAAKEAGDPGHDANSHVRPAAPVRRPDGEYTRLRRQIIAQWAALILLFVVVAGLAVWLISVVSRQQRAVVLETPAAVAPAEQTDAATRPVAEPASSEPRAVNPAQEPTPADEMHAPGAGAMPEPEATSDLPMQPEGESGAPASDGPGQAPGPSVDAGDADDAARRLVALLMSAEPDPAAVGGLLASVERIEAGLRALALRRLGHPGLRALP